VWKVRNFLKVRPPKIPKDSKIKQDILNAFERDYTLYLYDFTVDVLNQKVYLYGTVNTHFEKSHAEKIASGIRGVIEVANYINVRNPWKWKSDAKIEQDVRENIFWDTDLDSDKIDVTVEDGTVNLKGKVKSWFNGEAAVHDAFEGGARSVRANLKLKDGSTYSVYYLRESDFYWPDYSFEYPY
jgi:osmotically-inducible protein OsmY